MLVFKSCPFLRGPSFSAYAKFSKKLNFLPPNTHTPAFGLNTEIYFIISGRLGFYDWRSLGVNYLISAKWDYFSFSTYAKFSKKINEAAWTNRLCRQVFSATPLNPFCTNGFSIPPFQEVQRETKSMKWFNSITLG